MLTARPPSEMRAAREALVSAGFTERELRARVMTPDDHPVNATRYYPPGFPGHDTPLDALIRLLMVGARVSEQHLALGGDTIRTLIASGVLTREGSELRANVTLSLWHDLYFFSDREDTLTRADYVMPPEDPAVWMTALIAAHAPPPAARVLDIGTGCGVLALLAARTADAVVGIDSNPRAIAFARFNAAINDLSQCTFENARCQEVSASIGTFDRVLFNCPGLYEIGCLQPIAFSCADGDDLLRAVYALLPRTLTATGVAILRHELPRATDYFTHLLGECHARFEIACESRSHYAGLSSLRTCAAVVKLKRA